MRPFGEVGIRSRRVATNKPIPVRLRPGLIAYLDELDRLGGYGKGRPGVIRRFVENGIARAIQRKVLDKKSATDFGAKLDEDEEE
jgi:hypothetical protein